jgi:hypothetical protein
MTLATLPAGEASARVVSQRMESRASGPRIPGVFQLLLGLYIVLTGSFPTIIQALAFGLQGGAESEFAAAMITETARELLLLAPVLILANHRLGILHPLLLAVVVWPLLVGMPLVIQEFGGWAGILAGIPVETPYFTGLPSRAPSTIWSAIAKYNALEILSLVSTYLGFWLVFGKENFSRIPATMTDTRTMRFVLIGLIGFSLAVLLAFVYARGGISAHLTSLGQGRFRELAGDGVIIVLTDLGSIALALWIAARPNDVKSPLFLCCLALMTATQFISNGSRGSALTLPLTIGLVWALRKQQVPWRIALLLAPLMFASLGLMGAVRQSTWSGITAGEAYSETSWAESFANAEQEIAERRADSTPVPIVERGFAVTNGPMLGQTYVAAIASFVPRAIWEDKPRGAGSIYAQLFLGVGKDRRGIPVSATPEMYWNFGVLGVAILSFIYGMLLRKVYHFYWRRSDSSFALVFYVLFLTAFDFATKRIVEYEQQLGLLLICYLALAMLIPRSHDSANRVPNRIGGWNPGPAQPSLQGHPAKS